MKAGLAVVTMVLLGACAPVVTHGPRVQPGLEVTVTGGTLRALCDSPCGEGDLVPRLGFGGRYGWAASDSGGVGVMAGIAFPAVDLASPELDVYVQAPAGPRSPVFGLGGLVSPRYVMPYAQLGWDLPASLAVYGTVGYSWFFESPAWAWLDPPDSAYRAPRYFAPSLSVRLPTRRGGDAMTLYVAGALGSFQETRTEYPPLGGPVTRVERVPVRVLMTGVTLSSRMLWPPLPAPRRGPSFPPVGAGPPPPDATAAGRSAAPGGDAGRW